MQLPDWEGLPIDLIRDFRSWLEGSPCLDRICSQQTHVQLAEAKADLASKLTTIFGKAKIRMQFFPLLQGFFASSLC